MVNNNLFDIIAASLRRIQKGCYSFSEPTGRSTRYRPFFSAVQVKSSQSFTLEIENGGVTQRTIDDEPHVSGRVEIRVGNYRKGGGLGYQSFKLPIGLDRATTERAIWSAANRTLWECIEDYEDRRRSALGFNDGEQRYLYFSREKPRKFVQPATQIDIQRLREFEETLMKFSVKLLDEKIIDSEVYFDVTHKTHHFMSSEGTRLFTNSVLYTLALKLRGVSPDKLVIPHMDVFHCFDFDSLPSYETLIETGERIKRELSGILVAPVQRNDIVPAIIDPRNHAVLWHEMIGHSLEGHRLQKNEDGDIESPFYEKLGDQVAPEFLSLYDDPCIEGMLGSYKFDEDGVSGQRVLLIDHGKLIGYLHSRQSAGLLKTKSNGHARSGGTHDRITPRMSNLTVKSDNEVGLDQLKENLIKECEKQGKKYGLMMVDCGGGLSMPEECHFETYPAMIFRVYATGRTEQVRGVYVVGTPYQTLQNIVQTSNQYDPFNGICYAESGRVPTTEIAPHALLRSVEVNKIPRSSFEEMRTDIIPKPRRR